MAIRPIDGNKLIEWFSPYLHTGEPIQIGRASCRERV